MGHIFYGDLNVKGTDYLLTYLLNDVNINNNNSWTSACFVVWASVCCYQSIAEWSQVLYTHTHLYTCIGFTL